MASDLVPYEEFRARRLRQEIERRFGLGGAPMLNAPEEIAASDRTLRQIETNILMVRAAGPYMERLKAA